MTDDTNAEIIEELESLEAIYGDDLVCERDPETGLPSELLIKGSPIGDKLPLLEVQLPDGYPGSAVAMVVCGFRKAPESAEFSQRLGQKALCALSAKVAENAGDLLGHPHVFDVVMLATDWLTEWIESGQLDSGNNANDGSDSDNDDDGDPNIILPGAELKKKRRAPKWWEISDEDEDEVVANKLIREATNAAALAESHRKKLSSSSTSTAADAPSAVSASIESMISTSGKKSVSQIGWNYVIGLVGKPSSGKSTFFNAACGLLSGLGGCEGEDGAAGAAGGCSGRDDSTKKMAKMAAHPFTTLDPNLGKGYAAVPCACHGEDPRCAAPWGHSYDPATGKNSLRIVPVTLKDVAGLVPGAYKGRGRGNRFLDDLNDADVLIHIVDVSGETDSEGRSVVTSSSSSSSSSSTSSSGSAAEFGGADPAEDIGWIRSELHRWIYDNVRAKWAAIRRKPEKLAGMFSGYHADRALVRLALTRAGVDTATMALNLGLGPGGAPRVVPLPEWGPRELHLVVAHFLRTRFPIVLALNKADSPAAVAAGNVAHVHDVWPLEPAVPVSARGELLLQQLRKDSLARYAQGARTFELDRSVVSAAAGRKRLMEASYSSGMRDAQDENKPVASSDEVLRALEHLKRNVLNVYHTSGVVATLAEAMAQRPPTLAFPVANLASLAPLVPFDGYAVPGPKTGVFRDCVLLKPGCTVGDLAELLKHEPWKLLAGDYVYAEALSKAAGGTKATVHKDDLISAANAIIFISMTRRAV